MVSKPIKTLSQGRLNQIYNRTTKAYKKACKELNFDDDFAKEKVWNGADTIEEYREMRAKVDTAYIKFLKELSTQDLDDVLLAVEQGLQKRAPRTIDAIATELLERSLRDEK